MSWTDVSNATQVAIKRQQIEAEQRQPIAHAGVRIREQVREHGEASAWNKGACTETVANIAVTIGHVIDGWPKRAELTIDITPPEGGQGATRVELKQIDAQRAHCTVHQDNKRWKTIGKLTTLAERLSEGSLIPALITRALAQAASDAAWNSKTIDEAIATLEQGGKVVVWTQNDTEHLKPGQELVQRIVIAYAGDDARDKVKFRLDKNRPKYRGKVIECKGPRIQSVDAQTLMNSEGQERVQPWHQKNPRAPR